MQSDVVGAAMTARQQRALREWQNRPVQHFGRCCECGRDHAGGHPLWVTGHRRSAMRCRSCVLTAALPARARAQAGQLELVEL